MLFKEMPTKVPHRNKEVFFIPSICDDDVLELYNNEYESEIDDEFKRIRRKERWAKEMQGTGKIATLAQLAIQVFGEHFNELYLQVTFIPQISWELFIHLLPPDVDMGYAAAVVRDGGYWRKCSEYRWPGNHQIEYAGDSWKRYFLERYFAEYLEKADIDTIDYLEVKRLAESFAPFIHKLEISQLNVPEWPTAIETTDSTPSSQSSPSEASGMTDMTLDTYLTRHVRYNPQPIATDRIYLGSVFRTLVHLKELKISFGYKNYLRYNVISFASINRLDSLRLASAIEAIKSLTKLTITSSLVPEEMWDVFCEAIECHNQLTELELSRMQLGDRGMKHIIHVLCSLTSLRVLRIKENDFTSLGTSILCQVLMRKKIPLEVLDFSYNKLDDVGGCIFASFLLQHRYLRKLYLSACGLQNQSGKAFGRAIKHNTSLQVLDLSVNNFSYKAGKKLLRGVEINKTLTWLDVRGCGLPKYTVKDIIEVCFEHAERIRSKKRVYPNISPESLEPKTKTFPPESEDDEPLKLQREEEMKKKMEAMEAKKKKIQAFISKRLSEISDNISDISDFLMKKKDAESRAGFTGTFSSGFGPGIDGLVEEIERKQLFEARKEVFDIEEAAAPGAIQKANKTERASTDKKEDTAKFQAYLAMLEMGLEQRKKLFGDMDAEEIVTAIHHLLIDSENNPLRPKPMGELFSPGSIAYIPEDEITDEESSILDEDDQEGEDMGEEEEFDEQLLLHESSSEAAFSQSEILPADEFEEHFRISPLKGYEQEEEGEEEEEEEEEESEILDVPTELSRRFDINLHQLKKMFEPKVPKEDSIVSIDYSEEQLHEDYGDVSDEPPFYEHYRPKTREIDPDERSDDNWEHYTIWGGKLAKLRGGKSKNIWLKRKWQYLNKAFQDEEADEESQSDEEEYHDDDENEGSGSSKSQMYGVYSSESVTVTEDGELSSDHSLPYWQPQVQRLY